MAYQRLQVSGAIDVIPSDTVPIPDPASRVMNSAANFTVAGQVTGALGFTTKGIQKNAILYNYGASQAYTVVSVDSDTQLTLTPSVAGNAADNFVIFNAPTLAATLYVGGAGNISVEMASNRDDALVPGVNPTIFNSVAAGTFMPTLVTRVRAASTTATNIKALF